MGRPPLELPVSASLKIVACPRLRRELQPPSPFVRMKSNVVAAVLVAGLSGVVAQSACSTVLVPTYTPPSVAPGWAAQLVVSGLQTPRSLLFDSAGALLVVERGKGVSRITFKDHGGTCLEVDKHDVIIPLASVSSANSPPDQGICD
jgi:glucose/arabinose dehydrogenase